MRAAYAALSLVVIVPTVVLPVAGDPSAPGRAPGPAPAERVHEVRHGDTLSAIAQRYGLSVSAIVAANRLANDQVVLRIGQRLVIPPSAGHGTPARVRPRTRGPALRPPPNLVLAVPDFGNLLPLFSWPVDGPITSTFGRRKRGWHQGIDIKADFGVPIYTAAPGIVAVSAYEPRYGRVIKIEHTHGFMTVYAHNDENSVEAGDRVSAGQRIGVVGQTGRATAYHLHFEIRRAGLAYNPLYLLPLPRAALVDGSQDAEMHEDSDE